MGGGKIDKREFKKQYSNIADDVGNTRSQIK